MCEPPPTLDIDAPGLRPESVCTCLQATPVYDGTNPHRRLESTMKCPNCGTDNPPSATVCQCGYELARGEANLPKSLAEQAKEIHKESIQHVRNVPSEGRDLNQFQASETDVTSAANVEYAGFWIRVVAYVIDFFVLIIPITIAQSIFAGESFLWLNVVGLSIWWIYYAILESSKWQGTVGKKVLQIKVTDAKGDRISFARASGRYWAMLPAAISIIGTLWIAVDEKKQGLHDKLAGCFLMRGIQTIAEAPTEPSKGESFFSRKPIVIGCAVVLLSGFAVLVAVTIWVVTSPDGGVRLSNNIEDYALEYLEAHNILEPSEELVAYYDVTMSLDGTEVAILTTRRIIYHMSGRTMSIDLRDIEEIRHRYDAWLGDIIEIESASGITMEIEIAPFNNGETFKNVLMSSRERSKQESDTH